VETFSVIQLAASGHLVADTEAGDEGQDDAEDLQRRMIPRNRPASRSTGWVAVTKRIKTFTGLGARLVAQKCGGSVDFSQPPRASSRKVREKAGRPQRPTRFRNEEPTMNRTEKHTKARHATGLRA
jgi:hypothetical protein